LTETVLVIPVLLIVILMTPWVAHLFLDLLEARTEAHRDTYAKANTMVLMPEALMDNHVNTAMSAQFGALTTRTRRHTFASSTEVPEVLPDVAFSSAYAAVAAAPRI